MLFRSLMLWTGLLSCNGDQLLCDLEKGIQFCFGLEKGDWLLLWMCFLIEK